MLIRFLYLTANSMNFMSNTSKPSFDLERQLSVFKTVTSALTLKPNEFLTVVCQVLSQAFEIQHADFAQFLKDQNEFIVVAEFCSDSVVTLGRRIPLEGDEFAQELVRDKKPVTILDSRNEVPRYREKLGQIGVISTLIVPVVSGDQVLGTLALKSFLLREFSAIEQSTVQN